jgi:hypothetical protein
MATVAVAKVDNQVPNHAETTVRRLEDFPELAQALRDGDLPTVRFLWEQLCECDEQRTSWDLPTPKLKAAASG